MHYVFKDITEKMIPQIKINIVLSSAFQNILCDSSDNIQAFFSINLISNCEYFLLRMVNNLYPCWSIPIISMISTSQVPQSTSQIAMIGEQIDTGMLL